MRHKTLLTDSKGYYLEYYCCLTLEFNGWHVKRNAMSYGIEDVIAIDGDRVMLIQCKNVKRKHNTMTKEDIQILKKHAEELGAIPVYLFKDGRGKYIWQEVTMGFPIEFLTPFTREWLRERNKTRKMLKTMKKKSKSDYNKYVLKNWDTVKGYIC